jgi:hypothetical protein
MNSITQNKPQIPSKHFKQISCTLLACNVEGRQSITIALINDESTFLRLEKLLDGVEAAEACGKMQWALVAIVLDAETGAERDQILQRADLALATGVVQRRAPRQIALVQQQRKLLLRLRLE